MKKVFCMLLAIIIAVSLCGCFGGIEPDDVRGDIVSGNSNKNDEEPEFSLGKATNNTYNNDFLGVSCTLPSEWVFYSDEQILELNNIVEDVVDEEIVDRLQNANIIYDMYATNETEGSNMNINLEKLSAVQMATLDIKQILESQFDAIKSGYQNMGYTDININYQEIIVDGKTFDGLKLTAKIQDVDFYLTIFTFKRSNYLANITLASLQTDKTDTLLSYFTIK